MKHCNWLDWDSDGNVVEVVNNNAIAGTPLISLSVGAGGFNFSHTMRPDQARALASDLKALADKLAPVVTAGEVVEEVAV